MLYGARVTLPLSLLVVVLAATVGAIIGAIAGYFRGPLDGLCMRSTDLVFAFPPIILAMVVAAVLGRGLQNAAIAIVIVAWPPYARIVRGLVMSVGDSEYVQSARLLGASARRALVRDVLPNVAGPVLVLMTLDLATAILLLSGLSFLGLGAQPPQAEWGSMVADGTQYFQWWWMGTFPGLAIFTVVARVQLPGRQPPRRVRPADRLQGARGMSLLEVDGLRVRLPAAGRLLTVVDGVDYRVEQGEVFGVAGESGSGKTMSMLALLGVLPDGAAVEGRVSFDGRDLLGLSAARRRELAGRDLAMVFQDPMTSLHPMLTVGRAADRARPATTSASAAAPPSAVRSSCSSRCASRTGRRPSAPTRTSSPAGCASGSRSRSPSPAVPKLLIADEPTTALDVTVQAGILRLLDRLRRENDLAVILITHDLGVMSAIADRVSIFYAGRVVESGSREDVLRRPRHPYTRALLDALPHPELRRDQPLVAIPGSPPNPGSIPPGCAFNPRCAFARGRLPRARARARGGERPRARLPRRSVRAA